MKVFRTNFLKPSTIGVVPQGNYRSGAVQSHVAYEWLRDWYGIRTGWNHLEGEALVCGYYVDG